MKNIISVIFSIIALTMFGKTISFETSNDTLPSGWKSDGQWGFSKYQSIQLPFPNIMTTASGSASLQMSSSVAESEMPDCDNVIVKLTISNHKPNDTNKVDKVSLFVSSQDSFSNAIQVGRTYECYQPDSGEWGVYEFRASIPGIKSWERVYFKVKFNGVYSKNQIWVRELSYSFLPSATPENLKFSKEPIVSDENAIIECIVVPEPPEKIDREKIEVVAFVKRNGLEDQVQMVNVDGDVYSCDILKTTGRQIEAGESFEIYVQSTYECATEALGEPVGQDRYREVSDCLTYTAPKLGSVWINEITDDRIELCGTTNRNYIGGWSVVFSNASEAITNSLGSAEFDFSTNMFNGVIGFLDFPINVRNRLSEGTYSVVLLNSAEIAETKPRSVEFPVSGSYGMNGVYSWQGSFGYDWSSVGLSDCFQWAFSNKATPGSVNDGQFFETSGAVRFNVYTYIPPEESDFMAGVNVNVEFDTSKGISTTNFTTSSNGWLERDEEVYVVHTNTTCLNAGISAKAFGWLSEPCLTNFALGSPCVVSNKLAMAPSTGDFKNDDDFISGKLEGWENCGLNNKWKYTSAYGGALEFDGRSAKKETGDAIFKCKNYLMTSGKRYANVSFCVRNDISNKTQPPDAVEIQLSRLADFSSASELASTPPRYDKNLSVGSGTWMPFDFVWDVSCGHPSLKQDKIYLRINGSPNYSKVVLDIKDFRIAFQDMVTIETNGVENIVEGAAAGSTELTFNAKLKPWATEAGVSNVSAYVVYSVDDGQSWSTNYFAVANAATDEKTVLMPDAHFQLTTLTNIQSVVALKNPLEGWDGVKYYFGVDYFADNRDPDPDKQYETRYWPDNAKVDENGVWCCEGLNGYEHGLASAEITGEPAFFTVGGQEQGTNSLTVTFRLHDDNGIENASITINGVTSNFVITAGTKTFTGTFTVNDLKPNTSYEASISGNNGTLSATTNFCTLATAVAPTLYARTANSLTVKADGCNAEKIKFSCTSVVRNGEARIVESDWISPHESYPFTNLPESDGSNIVTVAWVKNKAGVITATSASDLFFTMPAAPTESVTTRKGAEWDSYVVYVTNITGYAAGAFGNASDAHYALFVEGVGNDGKQVATNWLCDVKGEVAESATQENLKWQTLEEWNEQPIRLSLTTTETNLIYLVAGGRDGKVNGYDPTGADSKQRGCLVEFSLALEKFRKGDMPVQADGQDGTYGYVTLTNKMMSPFKVGLEDAAVTYDFLVDGGAWKPMTLNAADCVMEGGVKPGFDKNVVYPVINSDCISNAVVVTWDATEDLERGTNYNVTIRATMHDGYHSDVAVTYDNFLLDLEPPKVTVTSAKTLTNANPIEFTVTLSDGLPGNLDAETAYLTSKDQFTVENGSIVEGGITGKGLNYTVKVNPKQAVCDVALTVNEKTFKDKVGNDNDASNKMTVTYDHSAPTDLEIIDELGNGAVTQATNFEFTAQAKDDDPPITYTWTFGDRKESKAEKESFVGDGLDDGSYTVSVYATDAAGNASAPTSWTWTVDTHSPSNLAFGVCTPTNGAVVATDAFSFTATAMDATPLEYHWILNGKVVENCTVSIFTNSDAVAVLEGTNTVEVCAEDAAGNVSVTNSLWWVVDRNAPTGLRIDDEYANGSVTTNKAYQFKASAADATRIAYRWTLDSSVAKGVAGGTGATFAGGGLADELYTVTVRATDEAGNESCTNWTWRVDTTAPEDLNVTGLPILDDPTKITVTNGNYFAFTASAKDETAITYHWATNDVNVTDNEVADFAGYVGEGTNWVSVYATDVVSNRSDTVTRMWVVDTIAPTNLILTSKPAEYTRETNCTFSAKVEDRTKVDFHWAVVSGIGTPAPQDDSQWLVRSGVVTAEQTDVGLVQTSGYAYHATADGGYTVYVYTTDEAGNKSAVTNWSWTVDTTPPKDLALWGLPISDTPEKINVTNGCDFAFTASADDMTEITYHWATNVEIEVAGQTSSNFVGQVSEGTNWVSVYATDKAGNSCEANKEVRTWVVDMTPPEMQRVDGAPAIITRDPAFALTAVATDNLTSLRYYWTFNGAGFEGQTLSSGDLPAREGLNTASVYAKDDADWVSQTNTVSWTLDTIAPTGTLETVTASRFNKKAAPMVVTVKFDEPVTNFTDTVITTEHCWVSNVTTVVEKREFEVTVWPDAYEVVGTQDVISVWIEAGQVFDAAGNGNARSATLTRTYDTMTPIVTLSSDKTPPVFNAKVPFVVTVVVSGKEVTDLSAESIKVENGSFTTLTPKSVGADEKTYELTVDPDDPTADGVEIKVWVPEGVVSNVALNVNERSDTLVRTYDNVDPTELKIFGYPLNTVTSKADYEFTAQAKDKTELKYTWQLNENDPQTLASNVAFWGTVDKGTNTVTVFATDAAGNFCAAKTNTWVYDFQPPTKPVFVSGGPGMTNGPVVVTKETDFTYRVHATDDFSKIEYHWATNVGEVVDNRSAELVGTSREGTNTVIVCAWDEAENVSETNSVTWVVDTVDPTISDIFGTPAENKVVPTNGFELAISATDATQLTYHWTLNENELVQSSTSSNFIGTTTKEGTNIVSVTVEDEAHNISGPKFYKWVVDMTDPEQLELSGAPEQGDVIAATNFEFHAEAKDDTKLKFRWTLNTNVVDITTADFVDALAVEGTNTVTVYAEDEAGNTCAPTSRWWVVDTIVPTRPEFKSVLPDFNAVTNGAAFAFTVQAEDATQLKYHWLTNGTEVADHYDPSFGGTAVEGTNTVSVYAEDEAHNVSLTNHISWTYDFKGPSRPKVDGAPMGGATNERAFDFTASATDDWSRKIAFYWSLSDGQTKTEPAFSGDVKDEDGKYTMSVWAIDEAGNSSETNSWSWILDRVDPAMPEISGDPKSNSFVKVANYDFTAALPDDKPDATTVEYHWTLDEDPTETVVTNFEGSVTEECKHTVRVYARDAAGNVSPTNSLSWTYDKTAPVMQGIDGTPANNSVTNVVKYRLQAQVDEVNPVKFYWTLDGVTMTTTDRDAWFEDEVPEGFSNHVVTCYAKDAAGNVSVETNVLCWTVDTLAPTNLVISGMPANLATTNGVDYCFTATAEDDMKRMYHWTLDGDAKIADLDEGVPFEGNVASGYGTHVLTCYATDVAGNVSETNSWSWTVDTKLPVLQDLSGLPEDGALTNDPSFDFLVSAEDDTALTYHWTHLTTNGYESVGNQTTNYFGTVTNSLGAVIEGLHVVSVYAEDRAHNVSETNSISWTVDVTPPTVTLESSTSSLFNKSQSPMIVEVTFSEPVTNFTAALLTVTNDNVTAMEVITNNPVSYTVAVTPAHDGEVPVMVKANIVTDLAGNGNVASDTLTRNCDITLPTVTLDCPLFDRLVGFDDVTEDGLYAVTVTFSEPVTNFVKSSLTVNNCEVDSVTGEGADYTVMIRPSDGTNTIQIAADAVVDRAGNGNVASLERKCVYDSTPPTQPVISGTPGCGETTTSKSFNLTVETWDANGVDYYVWVVDGDEIVTDVPSLSGVVGRGLHTVSVYVFDKVLNMSDESEEYGWTVEDASGANIEFGGGVYLEVNPETHSTNSVEFTAVDFKPGADSTVTMHGFGVDPLPANAEAPNVFELKMRLVVSDSLGGERWHVTVKETAHFDTEAKDLTVTIPEAEMKHGTPAEPYDRLFIFGVDNKER